MASFLSGGFTTMAVFSRLDRLFLQLWYKVYYILGTYVLGTLLDALFLQSFTGANSEAAAELKAAVLPRR